MIQTLSPKIRKAFFVSQLYECPKPSITLYKKASEGIIDSILNQLKSMFDSNDIPGSLSKIFSPTLIFFIINNFGGGFIISSVITAIASYYDVDILSIIKSICGFIKDKFSSSGILPSFQEVRQQVEQVTQSIGFQTKQATNHINDKKTKFIQRKILLNNSNNEQLKKIYKTGQFTTILSTIGKIIPKFLVPLLTFIFATALSLFIKSKTSPSNNETSKIQTTQKLFVAEDSGEEFNIENIWYVTDFSKDTKGIEEMLLSFTAEVYKDPKDIIKLDDPQIQEIIANTPNFKRTVYALNKFNKFQEEDAIQIPDIFKSKKDLVDKFIDQAADAIQKSLPKE